MSQNEEVDDFESCFWECLCGMDWWMQTKDNFLFFFLFSSLVFLKVESFFNKDSNEERDVAIW